MIDDDDILAVARQEIEKRESREEAERRRHAASFRECFGTIAGKRVLQLLRVKLRADEADLSLQHVEADVRVQRETMRSTFWWIHNLAKAGETLEGDDEQVG